MIFWWNDKGEAVCLYDRYAYRESSLVSGKIVLSREGIAAVTDPVSAA